MTIILLLNKLIVLCKKIIMYSEYSDEHKFTMCIGLKDRDIILWGYSIILTNGIS